MKNFIFLSTIFIASLAAIQPFDFTVASLNLNSFDTAYTGVASAAPNNTFNSRWAEQATIFFMQYHYDAICFQEWPGIQHQNNPDYKKLTSQLNRFYELAIAPGSYGGLTLKLRLAIAYDKNKFEKVSVDNYFKFKQTTNSVADYPNGFFPVILKIKGVPKPTYIGVISTHFKDPRFDKNATPVLITQRRTAMANAINNFTLQQRTFKTTEPVDWNQIHWIVCGDFNTDQRANELSDIVNNNGFSAPNWHLYTVLNHDTNAHTFVTGKKVVDYIFSKYQNKPFAYSNAYLEPLPSTNWSMPNAQPTQYWFSDHALIAAKFILQIQQAAHVPLPAPPAPPAPTPVLPAPKPESIDLHQLASALQELHAHVIREAQLISRPAYSASNSLDKLEPIIIDAATLKELQSLATQKLEDPEGILLPARNNLRIVIYRNNTNNIIGTIANDDGLEITIEKEEDKIRVRQAITPTIRLGLAVFEYLRTNKPLPTGTGSASSTPPAQVSVGTGSALSTPPAQVSVGTGSASSTTPTQVSVGTKQQFAYKGMSLEVEVGDILKSKVDAIVNAANEGCQGGGGIDGVITSQGGGTVAQKRNLIKPRIGMYTKKQAVCPTGEARLTISGNIKTKYEIPYVLHAVGPICSQPTTTDNATLLKGAYLNSLLTAADFNLYLKDGDVRGHDEFKNVDEKTSITSVAFPAISGKIFGCPATFIAQQAADAIKEFAAKGALYQTIKTIKFMLFDPADAEAQTALYHAFITAIKGLVWSLTPDA